MQSKGSARLKIIARDETDSITGEPDEITVLFSNSNGLQSFSQIARND
jgi:hypothetical protein